MPLRTRRLLSLLLIIAALLGLAAFAESAGARAGSARSPLPDDPARPAGEQGPPSGLLLAVPPRPEGNPHLDSALLRLAAAARLSAAAAQGVEREEALRVEDGRVHAQIAIDPARADAVIAAVRAAGGDVTGAARGGALLQA